jgi:predicted dehydrogenase
MELSEPIRLYDKQVTDSYTKPTFIDTFASFRSSIRDGDILIPRVAVGEPLKTECDHFVECIRSAKQPLTSGKEGVAVVKALEAIERSIRASGREEKVSA